MQKIASELLKTRLFNGVSEENIERLISLVGEKIKSYKKNDNIVKADERIKNVGIILKGTVRISRLYVDGRQILLQTLPVYSALGIDIIATTSGVSPFFMSAGENVDIYFIPACYIFKSGIIDENTRIILITNILTMVSHENMRHYYRIETLSYKSIRKRIESYLYMIMDKCKTNTFEIEYDREALANYLCVNRTALSNELSQMKKDGLIDFKKNKFKILKRE